MCPLQVLGPPPPVGVYKINIDASLATSEEIKAAAVVRNSEGVVLCAKVWKVMASWDPITAKSWAALSGLQLAVSQGWSHIILESDCLNLISKIKRETLILLPIFSG